MVSQKGNQAAETRTKKKQEQQMEITDLNYRS